MSKILRSPGLIRLLVVTAFGLVPIGFPLLMVKPTLAHPFTSQDYGGQDPGVGDFPNPFGPFPGDFDLMRRRAPRTKGTGKTGLTAAKGTAKKTTKKDTADKGQIKFSQDIAPILVAANCVGCHGGEGAGVRKGKLDLTTYENLKKGSQKRTDDPEIVVAGKPSESHLVLRIKGEETPRMPQGGNNNRLSTAAIAKIEQWVKEGAKLDAGLDPKKPIKSYAASPEQVARNQIAKLPPGERDKKIEEVGRERWKQANPKLKPEIVSGDHFVMFSNQSNDRATSTLKVMETQYGHLKKLLSSSNDWVEKVSVYVFPTRNDFIEFVRTVESREADLVAQASGKLSIPQPYLAVVDPAGGKREEPGAGKRKTRSRRGGGGAEADTGSGDDRTLAGILTEALGTGALAASGNPPRWLAQGVGAYMAGKVEPRSHYYAQLRQTAFANFGQGWKSKANEALGGGDQIAADGVHSIGFALVEAMMASQMSQGFPAFVKGMLQGGDKLDEVLLMVYGGNRDEFLDGTGEWVAAHYGRLQ